MYLIWDHGASSLISIIVIFALVCVAQEGQVPLISSLPNAASAAYQSQQARYWASNQADFTPSCRISPTTGEEVGALVSQLAEFGDDVRFAISSGGHATASGASNVDDGITLDLSALDSVSLASDRSYVDVGTGTRWLDVYRALDPFALTATGGRAASVGVGGYLLGGI
ncbi:hypothetical protein CLCR_01712 [Cladophialophora carrionii]|uniref:FAD-binding PCMH-type domain-containing protein n=1 Tax=Cladophialophora carrionii TaxID=86049 RepID=A0A1C1CB18_9EURO|nr:hypothetical protein CLCR_01712 [Cladophialophora carrionii]